MTAVAPDRLRSPRDIAATLRARTTRAGRFVVVHARRRDDGGAPRIAYVASRKVGGAVDRNRAKRLLREAARELAWQPGTDIVLVARATASSSGMRAVAADLASVAGSLELVRP